MLLAMWIRGCCFIGMPGGLLYHPLPETMWLSSLLNG